MSYILGITGGIASGKSTVAKCLAGEKTYIIEVDDLARPMLQPGCEVYDQILDKFGKKICNTDGSINRNRLANAAFSTSYRVQLLNEIFYEPLTKAIKIEILEGRAKRANLIIVVAGILYEQHWDDLCHGVLNISAPESLRIERSIVRGLTEKDVQKRIAAQISEKDRLHRSNWVVYTQPTIEQLCARVRQLAAENKWL